MSITLGKLYGSDGRANLAKLNIPSVNVGTATLSGAGGNITALTLNNVTFLSYASDQAPRLWATNSIAGTNGGTPAVGTTVSLTQSGAGTNASGLTANFNVRTWDTGSGKWAATITDGAGTVNSNTITFKGGAGGEIVNPTSFNGTAAGWAK